MSNHRVPKRFRHQLGMASILCLVVLSLGSAPWAEAAFSTPANLSLTMQDSSSQQVASSGSNVYIVWRDNPSAVFNPEILFARSTDGGKTFGAWVNLSNRSGNSSAPYVAASGSSVYVIWSDVDGYNMCQSDNAGMTFGAPRNLTTLFGIPAFGSCALGAAGSNVYLSCQQSVASGDNDIFVSRSNDNGTTFSALQNISMTASTGSNKSRIAASGSNVYVVWEEGFSSTSEVYLARSIDSGVSFAAPQNMSSAAESSTGPAVDADGTNVWLVWSDRAGGGSDEVFYTRSTNAGASFAPLGNLSMNSTASSTPCVKGNGSQVFVTWADLPSSTPGSVPDVYLRGSSDGGITFDSAVNLSSSETINSNQPRLGLTDLAVSVFWGEPAGFKEIYHSYQELSVPIPPPSMLSLSPASGTQTQTVDVVLDGAGFQSASQWQLSGTGVTVSDVEFVSPTAMKAKMNVALTATPGGRHLTVTNPDGKSATLSGAFTVMSASVLMLIDIARTDVNMGAGNGGFLTATSSNGNDGANSSYKSLLAHLDNAEKALLQQPPDAATAVNQIDAFYIKIGNLAKGKKPEITPALYTTLYNDYAMVMGSLGGTVKPAH